MCNRRGHNTGEYVRNVFNNLDFFVENPEIVHDNDVGKVLKDRSQLRRDYRDFLDGATFTLLETFQKGWGR